MVAELEIFRDFDLKRGRCVCDQMAGVAKVCAFFVGFSSRPQSRKVFCYSRFGLNRADLPVPGDGARFPSQSDDDFDASDLHAFRNILNVRDGDVLVWDVEDLVFIFEQEMVVIGNVGVEPHLGSIDGQLSKEASFGELVERVVNRGQRYWHADAHRFRVQYFGGDVPIAIAVEQASQSHTLARRAEPVVLQCLADLMRYAS